MTSSLWHWPRCGTGLVIVTLTCFFVAHRPFVQALTALPENHFSQFLYLLPERKHSSGIVSVLISMENLLQAANFGDFWTLASDAEARAFLDQVHGFDDAIRTCA